MAERPEKFPEWATEDQTDPVSGQVNRSEPPDGRKASGWNRQEMPPRQWLNWLTWKAGQWVEWLTGRVDELRTDVDAAQATADDHIAEGVAQGPHGIGSVSAFAGDQNLRTTDTVQFGRVTDAASPGDGDFDSGKLGYWEATVELGGDFNAGQKINIKRIGPAVFIQPAQNRLSHDNASFVASLQDVVPSWAAPSGSSPSNLSSFSTSNIEEISVTAFTLRLQISYRDYGGGSYNTTESSRNPVLFYTV